jgi:hypothetical protein
MELPGSCGCLKGVGPAADVSIASLNRRRRDVNARPFRGKETVMKRASIVALAAALAAGSAWTAPAVAQGAGASGQPGMEQKQGASFSDEQLKTFAEAVKEVKQISNEYQPKMAAAKSEEEQQVVRQEATAEMVEAIEKKGLSVDQYNRIAMVARTDPATAAKINRYIR